MRIFLLVTATNNTMLGCHSSFGIEILPDETDRVKREMSQFRVAGKSISVDQSGGLQA